MNVVLLGLGVIAGGCAALYLSNREADNRQRLANLQDQLAWREKQARDLSSQIEQLLESMEEEPWMRDVIPANYVKGVVYMNTHAVEFGDQRTAIEHLADALHKNEYIPHSFYLESRGRNAVYPMYLDDDGVWIALLSDFYAVVWSVSHTTAQRMVEESFRRGVGVSLAQAHRWWNSCNGPLLIT